MAAADAVEVSVARASMAVVNFILLVDLAQVKVRTVVLRGLDGDEARTSMYV